METKLTKWGNSLAVPLSKEIVAQTSLSSGDKISVTVEKDGRIVLTPMRPRSAAEELLEAISPKNRHSAVDWGRPAGKEAW